MHCADFERIWNEQMDLREAALVEVQEELERHARSCRSCAQLALRYQALGVALQSLGPVPSPPAGFPARFLASHGLPPAPVPRVLAFRRAIGSFAAAASLFLLVALGGRGRPQAPPAASETASAASERRIDASSLTDALAHAGSATWELAVQTSAPAARVGREVLDPSGLVDPDERLPLTVPLADPGRVFQSVGDRLNAGVRPFSGTARHAFGFLLGPPAAEAGAKTSEGA
jgi:hypothetical protein